MFLNILNICLFYKYSIYLAHNMCKSFFLHNKYNSGKNKLCMEELQKLNKEFLKVVRHVVISIIEEKYEC